MRIKTDSSSALIKFGKNVKTARKALNMTQEDLAQLLCKSRVSIHNIESGRHRPILEDILKLCVILKKTPNDLLPPLPSMKVVNRKKEIVKKTKVINQYVASFKW